MKKIAFDVGQVLCYVNLEQFIEKYNWIVSKCAPEIPIKDGAKFLEITQERVDKGNSSMAGEIKFLTKKNIVIKTVLDAWNNCLTPCQKVIDFKNKLLSENFDVAIMSNMGSDHYNFIKKTYPQVFNGCKLFLSFTARTRKPERDFFKTFIAQNPKFNRCIYVDDLEENLKTSKLYKFTTYKFDLQKTLNIEEDLDNIYKLLK